MGYALDPSMIEGKDKVREVYKRKSAQCREMIQRLAWMPPQSDLTVTKNTQVNLLS